MMAKGTAKGRAQATAPSRYRYQYAVKFLCTANIPGTSQTNTAVVPGVYQTAVNIHNPNPQAARLRMKLAVRTGQISAFVDSQLKPDEATSVDCSQVQKFGIPFIHGFEGFLVIESTLSLDVVAVYTAGPRGGEVSSIDVEHVRERTVG
jgi:hypothetical protein